MNLRNLEVLLRKRFGFHCVRLGVFISLCLVRVPLRAFETAINPASLTGTAVVAQDYSVGYLWRQDADGCEYGPFVDLDLRQKLFQDYTAGFDLRVFKAASSDDAAELFLESADLAYAGSWFSLAGGRRDLSVFLGPGTFFGAYSTLGERWLDCAVATVPFRFFAGIPDADAQLSAPYNAFSILYVPNLFSADQSDSSGRQGLMLAQLRVKFRFGESFSDLCVNYTYGLDDYFLNGPADEAGSLDVSYAFHKGPYGLWGECAIQNMSQGQGTSVSALGASVDLSKWCFGLLDTLVAEVQIPLNNDPNNPFTGGDPQFPALAQEPQTCWFVEIKNIPGPATPALRLRLFYGGAITNSVGDYTLARLSNGSLSQPLGSGFGEGYKVEDMSLHASNYEAPCGIVYAGYKF